MTLKLMPTQATAAMVAAVSGYSKDQLAAGATWEVMAAAAPPSRSTAEAMADEYQAWIDFFHAGEGDYNDFLRKRAGVASPGSTSGVQGMPVPRYSGWLWTHTVKGGDYRMLGEAKLQTDKPLSDMAEVVVYQGADGRLWAREKHEFEARFSRTRPDAYGVAVLDGETYSPSTADASARARK